MTGAGEVAIQKSVAVYSSLDGRLGLVIAALVAIVLGIVIALIVYWLTRPPPPTRTLTLPSGYRVTIPHYGSIGR